MINISEAANSIQNFVRDSLTNRISEIESALQNKNISEITQYLDNEVINSKIIHSAFSLKSIISQIYVVIHSVGILIALPVILKENERIEYLSLGAGNTGRDFDLETTNRIAEFKFINWKGGAESIRQNSLFKDFYLLAESPNTKIKELYVIGKDIPLQFFNGNRAIDSVFSRNNKLLSEYKNKYHEQYPVVSDYYNYKKDDVQLIDISEIIPEIKNLIEIESKGDL
jgi:hypothetical protein